MTRLRLLVATITLAALALTASPASATLDRDPQTLAEILDSFGYRPEHADVLRLYAAFFERDPDPAGSLYWMRQFDRGSSLDDLAWSFSASAEFVARYGSTLDDASFLTIVYSNVLGRVPDPGGFDYWLGQMRAGLDQHEVVRWVTANDEFETRFPFVGTAPPLEGALVEAFDYGSDWSSGDASVATGPRRCSQLKQLPPGGVSRRIEGDRDHFFHRIDHGLYAFATNAAASDFIAERQAYALSCDATSTGNGGSIRVRPAGIGAVADERTGFVVSAVFNDVEVVNGMGGVIMARRGNVVSITIGGSNISYARGFHEEIQLVTVVRLDALAG